jgi:hypothetical protein
MIPSEGDFYAHPQTFRLQAVRFAGIRAGSNLSRWIEPAQKRQQGFAILAALSFFALDLQPFAGKMD